MNVLLVYLYFYFRKLNISYTTGKKYLEKRVTDEVLSAYLVSTYMNLYRELKYTIKSNNSLICYFNLAVCRFLLPSDKNKEKNVNKVRLQIILKKNP